MRFLHLEMVKYSRVKIVCLAGKKSAIVVLRGYDELGEREKSYCDEIPSSGNVQLSKGQNFVS